MTPAELARWWARGGLKTPPGADVAVTGADPVLPSRHRIGEGAAAALALVGARAAHLGGSAGVPVRVDVGSAAASLQGFLRQRLDRPGPVIRVRDATTALYQAGDGRWIHLHGGFPHLGDGLLDLLRVDGGHREDAGRIGAAVARWGAAALEDALAERGLCAAMVRSPDEWAAHPQGRALADEAVAAVEAIEGAGDRPGWSSWSTDSSRPLRGLRVLDLTRVLAGPTCGRTLALFGADVLRIGASRLPSIEPFVLDTGAGKRNAFLDLTDPGDAARARSLAAESDVVVCGYRPGALDRLGFGPDQLLEMRPGLVVVLIDCYGHEGPWAGRPGWEQLAQCVTGMAAVEGAAVGGAAVEGAAVGGAAVGGGAVEGAAVGGGAVGGGAVDRAAVERTALEDGAVPRLTSPQDLDLVIGRAAAAGELASGRSAASGRPALVPAAATDYTTGYLAAAGVLDALARQREAGGSHIVRASLCATAMWVQRAGVDADPQRASGVEDLPEVSFDTAWGRLGRLAPPLEVDGLTVAWDRPPSPLGSDRAEWLPRP